MHNHIKQTQDVVIGLTRISRYQRTVILASLTFFILFLSATQQVSLADTPELTTITTDNPWRTMVERTSLFQFEPALQVQLTWIQLFINPFNLIIAALISILVGYNLAITHAAFKQPKACQLSPAQGVAASLPGLLAGSACCAPVILLILGVQVSTAILTFFSYLLPIAFLLLIGNLVWSSQHVAPEALH